MEWYEDMTIFKKCWFWIKAVLEMGFTLGLVACMFIGGFLLLHPVGWLIMALGICKMFGVI